MGQEEVRGPPCSVGKLPGVGDVGAEVVVLQGAAGFPQDWHKLNCLYRNYCLLKTATQKLITKTKDPDACSKYEDA